MILKKLGKLIAGIGLHVLKNKFKNEFRFRTNTLFKNPGF